MEESTTHYEQIVRTFRETKSPALFGNERPEHAAIIFREFFYGAEKRVVMLVKNLANSVFGREEVRVAMEVALRKRVAVDIVVQEEIESPELRETLAKWKSDGLPLNFVEAHGELADEKANIAVMDGTAFRLEPNNGETKAFACMHDPKHAKVLENQVYGYLAELT
jgi:hypothetical protein